MDYIPLVLGLGAAAGLITYVELTLRREKLSGLRARQSIIDRRLMLMKSALERIERRLDAMTVDRELVTPGVDVAEATASPSPSRRSCLDCGSTDAHAPDCALSMDNLIESPMDAAARRGRD